jgi:hypothetical protein
MSLVILMVASAVTAAPPEPRELAPMPNFYRPPARCGVLHDQVVRHVQTADSRRPGRHYAVLRQVDGCPVPAPAGYRQDYLLPGAADAPQSGPPTTGAERRKRD